MILASLQLVLGLIYGVFIYGWLWSRVFFPAPQSLTKLERLVVSLGLSLVLQPLVLFVSHRLLLPFDRWSFYLLELSSSLLAIAVYAIRQHYAPQSH